MSGQSQRMVEDAQGHCAAAISGAIKRYTSCVGGRMTEPQRRSIVDDAVRNTDLVIEQNEPDDPS